MPPISPTSRTDTLLRGLTLAFALLPGCVQTQHVERPPRAVSERFADLSDRPVPELAAPIQEEEQVPEDVVARFELTAPRHSPFVLHGTLPIPIGVYPRPDGQSPFRVVSHDAAGTRVPAQVAVVSRGPSGDPEVIEVLALVELAEDEEPGARVRFDVVADPCELEPAPEVPEATRALADPKGSDPILLACEDVFGNVYVTDLRGTPNGGFGSARILTTGVAARKRRVYTTLVPAKMSDEGAPLPHMMGVHAYITEWAGDARLSLDLRLNNGATSGSAKPERIEQPLGTIYWKSLELLLPPAWTAVPFVPDPFFGEPFERDGRTVVPLVLPNEDGSLHMMGPQAQFQRRLTLVPKELLDEKPQHAALDGLAFCSQGTALWSWFSQYTARFLPQRGVLATWGHYTRGGLRGRTGLRGRLNEEFEFLRDLVSSGRTGGSNVTGEVMGWAHPYYNRVQGGTGGEGINIYAGHRVAAAASARGYARLMLVHRMNACRQPEAAFDRTGASVGFHAWQTAQGEIPFDFRTNGRMVPPVFKLPMFDGPRASAHVGEVHLRGLRPAYDKGSPHSPKGELTYRRDNLLDWECHDGQHMVRYTKPAQALVWLGNDPLARDDLIHSAELFHLQFHEAPHVKAEWSDGVTLRMHEEHVKEHPHEGAHVGRDQAWGIESMTAAYCIANEEWRARNRAWFDRVARFLFAVAMPSGILQRNANPKLLGHDMYEAAQSYESLFFLHSMRCLIESVLRGENERLKQQLEEVYLRTLEYLFWEPIYAQEPARVQPPGRKEPLLMCGPRGAFAVGLKDGYKEPPFSNEGRWGENYLPKEGTHGGIEFFHIWSALEYGMLLSPELGAGLDNRYLKRSLQCWNRPGMWRAMVKALFAESAKPSNDNSGNWAGYVGRLQNLGVE